MTVTVIINTIATVRFTSTGSATSCIELTHGVIRSNKIKGFHFSPLTHWWFAIKLFDNRRIFEHSKKPLLRLHNMRIDQAGSPRFIPILYGVDNITMLLD